MKSTDLITQKAQGAREERKRRRGGEGRLSEASGRGNNMDGSESRPYLGPEADGADGSESRPYLKP